MSKPHVIYKVVSVHAVRVHSSSTCCGMLLPQCLEKYKCQMQIFKGSCSHELEVDKVDLEVDKVDKHLSCSSLPHVANPQHAAKPLEVQPLEVEELKRDDYISRNLVRSLRYKFFADARIEKIPRV